MTMRNPAHKIIHFLDNVDEKTKIDFKG